jgi:hypothetical protein
MTKRIRVELTGPQAEAVLSAIAEIHAGEADNWPAPEWRALMNARAKILTATSEEHR